MLKYRLKVAGDTEFLDVAPVFCDVIEAALAVFAAIRPLNGGYQRPWRASSRLVVMISSWALSSSLDGK